jgi:DNA-binding transcriptional LysR family regulator
MPKQNLMDIRLSQIQLLVTVYKMRSFTAAAKTLYVTQSTVSKAIASLEHSLGFELFNRTSAGLVPTHACDQLVGTWSDAISVIETTARRAEEMASGAGETIRLGISDGEMLNQAYRDIADAFMLQCSETFLLEELTPGALVQKLASKELDAVVTVDYEVQSLERLGMSWLNIADGYLQVSMNEENPLALRDSLDISDLRGQRIVTIDEQINGAYMDYLRKLCEEGGFEPSFGVCVPNIRSAMATISRMRDSILITNDFVSSGNERRIKNRRLGNRHSRMIIAWDDLHCTDVIRQFAYALASVYREIKG